jgi:hypothetical protein
VNYFLKSLSKLLFRASSAEFCPDARTNGCPAP